MVTDLPQNTAGVPCRNYICRYIFCYNTSCSDNCVISYCNSRKDHCPRPDPAPLSYVYRHIVLIHFFFFFRQDRIQKGFSRVRSARHSQSRYSGQKRKSLKSWTNCPMFWKRTVIPMCRRSWQPTARRRLLWSSTIVTLPHGSGRSGKNENPPKKSKQSRPNGRAYWNACASFRWRASRETSRDRERNPLTETADRHKKPPLWHYPCGGIHNHLQLQN